MKSIFNSRGALPRVKREADPFGVGDGPEVGDDFFDAPSLAARVQGVVMGADKNRVLLDATVMVDDHVAHRRVRERFLSHDFDIVEAGLSADTIGLESPGVIFDERNLGGQGGVVLLTNVLSYAFAWYRVWNEQLAATVLIPDLRSPAFAAPPSDALTAGLADFAGTEQEILRGKVFLDVDVQNAQELVALFRQERFLRHLEAFVAFPFSEPSATTCTRAPYALGRDDHPYFDAFRFEKLVHEEGFKETVVDAPPRMAKGQGKLYRHQHATLQVGPPDDPVEIFLDRPQAFVATISDTVAEFSPGLAKFVAAGVLCSSEYNFLQKHQVLRDVLEPLLHRRPELAPAMADFLVPLLSDPRVHKKMVPAVAFDIGLMTKQTQVLEAFASIADALYAGTTLDFSSFTVVNFIEKWFQIPPYKNYLLDQRRALQRIVDLHKPLVLPKVSVAATRGSKRLIILIGEADRVQYGPIQAGFGMAKLIKRENPGWDVAIAVTDRHRVDLTELCYPNLRPVSARWREDMEEILIGHDIELMVAPATGDRLTRLAQQLEAIRLWGPELVLSVDDDRDILRNLLFPDYPLIEVHVGSLVVKPDDADLYLSVFDEETRKGLFRRLNVPQEIQEKCATFMGTVEFGTPEREHSREEHALPGGAFLLGVVGYDLSFALREEVVEMLGVLLDQYPQLHLVLVGTGRVLRVVNQFSAVQLQRTHFLERVPDLAGFLLLLDGLFCPRRPGGGFSHCTAMAEGIPTVIERFDEGDVTLSAGKEMTFEGLPALREGLRKLIVDSGFRSTLKTQGIHAMERRKAISDTAMERLLAFFPIAETRFLARKASSTSSRPPPRRKSKRPAEGKKKSRRSRQRRR